MNGVEKPFLKNSTMIDIEKFAKRHTQEDILMSYMFKNIFEDEETSETSKFT